MNTLRSAMAITAALACIGAAAAAPEDGTLKFPGDYKKWATFLPSVDRKDTKQVRDIYLNKVAQGASAGKPLPDGSVLVMEIYNAKLDASGAPALDAKGKLEKSGLSKIFVMEKNGGWGQTAAIPNGSWVYAAFEPDGTPAKVDYATCRACHVPSADKDFVPRLDEYLAQR